MSKVRVYEVARQLNMDQKTLVSLFQSMGFPEVRNHMSAVEQDVVERVKRHIERQKAPEVVEERIAPTVVKRRAKVSPESRRKAKADEAASSPEAAPAPAPVVRRKPAAKKDEEAKAKPEVTPAPTPAEAPKAEPQAEAKAAPPSPKSSAASETKEAEAEPSPKTKASPAPDAKAPAAAAEPAKEAAPEKPEPVKAKDEAPKADAAPKDTDAKPSGQESKAESTPSESSKPPASAPPPSRPPSEPEAPKRVEPAPAAARPPAASEPPRRPSQPPKTGIDVWQGRPGVPMPQQPRSGPPARRTTYDPRASNAPQRPGAGYGPGGRSIGGRHRPGFRRPGGPQSRKAPPQVSTLDMASHKKVIKIEEQISLQQLAAKMSLKATDVLMRLLSMGMSGVNINSTLDADTAKILASEFGWSVEDVAVSEEESLEAAMAIDAEAPGDETERPPIITVMGHVDHGKTSLLDKIRRTSVASGEAGGITQHIGAYRVEAAGNVLTFLDTPGHEAFTAMRARGASLTDIVILVVAADDGVMPQTKEAIVHAKSAQVPIIVAVNKIDKEGADPERVMRDLSNQGLQPEDWGGDTIFCRVSALSGEGVDGLLEAVSLQSEILELRAQEDRRASGIVIEALLDRGRGPVARVLVQDGTLKTGDVLLAGSAWGKIRAMTDERGRTVTAAGPSTPVEVLGLNEVPAAGDPVHAVKDTKKAEQIAETRRKKTKSLIPQDSRVSLETLTTRLAEADTLELKLIIKGDVQGSVEAVGQALAKLTTKKVKVTIVHAGVGAITEGDVNLAVASKAIVVGFNVRAAGKAGPLAESEGVEIRTYNVIYNAVDDIYAAMEGLLPATKVEKALGTAEVRAMFRIAKVGNVAGCMVTGGKMIRGAEARLLRDGAVIYTGKLSGLRRFKDDAKEVQEGMECGLTLDGFGDIKEGDIVEAFEIEEVKTKLED